MTKQDKQFYIGLIGAALSIPFAILMSMKGINPGWAFILGIAYGAIWRKEVN